MDKQQERMGRCESMTSVTMKDFGNPSGMDYPDPPPSYKTAGGKSSAVQIAKISATAAVMIAGMLSISMIISAWITTSNIACQPLTSPTVEKAGQLVETVVLSPQLLQQSPTPLSLVQSDLDSSESKVATSTTEKGPKSTTSASDEDEEAEVEADDEEDVDTENLALFKVPLEFRVYESVLEKSQRMPMNCVVERKTAEELIPNKDNSTKTESKSVFKLADEKVSISCGPQIQELPPPSPLQILMETFRNGNNLPPFLADLTTSSDSNIPLHVFGSLPSNQQQTPSLPTIHSIEDILNDLGANGLGQMIPLLIPPSQRLDSSFQNEAGNNQPITIQEIGPIFVPQEESPPHSSPLSRILNLPDVNGTPAFKVSRFQPIPRMPPHEVPLMIQASEMQERALRQPIPILPRHPFPHAIRPRSADAGLHDTAIPDNGKRMKRCACDCACGSHSVS